MAKQEKNAAELYREERKARIAKAAKKNQKKQNKIILTKKSKAAIAIVVVIAIALGIGGFAIGNSGVLLRGKVAFTVGEENVSLAEYSYYYNSNYQEQYSYSIQFDQYYGSGMGAMYTGFDCGKTPDAQAYTSEIEGIEDPTWADYFAYNAKRQIQYAKAAKLYAAEKGIELDEDDYAEIETTMESIETTAKSGEQPYSLAAYLRLIYGKAMSVSAMKDIVAQQILVQKVSEVTMDEYKAEITDAKVEETYSKDLTAYGVVSLRTYEITAETVVNEEDESESVTDETMAAAKTKAESFASKVNSDESFKAIAYEFEKLAENEEAEEMKKDDSLTLLADQSYSSVSYSSSDEKFLDWAFDKDTAIGSTYIVEEEGSGYTVYMMSAPVHKAPDAKTYDVRHILVMFPKTEENKDEEKEDKKEEIEVELLDASAYDVTVDIDVDLENTGDKESYKKAQDILKEYLDGDKTENAFAELAKKYSEDDNAEQGGLYSGVTEGYMVAEFENWSLAKGREVGDVGIVESTYGYHIMYHVGAETTTWKDVIKTDLATEKYNDFAEKIIKEDNVKIANEDAAVIELADEELNRFAKLQARNASSSSTYTY